MNSLLKKWLNRNTYLLLAAIGCFALAILFNRYVTGTTSTRYYTNQLQDRLQQKERRFQQLLKNPALIDSLVEHHFSESVLKSVLEKETGYGIFIYDRWDTVTGAPRLLFWNTQRVLPSTDFNDTENSSRIVRLSNGIYMRTRENLGVRNDHNLVVISLTQVMQKFPVENENLKTYFTGFPDAIKHVDISNEATPYAVHSINDNVLFYLQKNNQLTPYAGNWSVGFMLLGFFLLFLALHQLAHYVSDRHGFWYGVLLLASVIVLLRLGSYLFPEILNLRQFELFDPLIYGSSYILSSLGDLLINILLICWIIIFINRRVNPEKLKAYPEPWKNWLLVCVLLFIQVLVTFTSVGILQSMVADAKISFNVTNFFSLISTPYSFIGFIIMATMALGYFFLSQVLLTFAGKLVDHRNYITFIITCAIGLGILTISSNNAMVELNLFVLPWLLLFIWLMQRRIFSGFNFRLNVSEVLFWLFVFSFSISAVIIFENRKIEEEQRRRYAERIVQQSDPANERLLSVTLIYLDSNFMSRNFSRFYNEPANSYVKDSIVRRINTLTSRYDVRIFSFDSTNQPLYNQDVGSYDTLNTIFQVQGRRMGTSGLRYFERSFDRFSYIYRRETFNRDSTKIGSIFVLADLKMFKSDALTPELFKSNRELVPEFASTYSYALYDSSNHLITTYNDYPFQTHLDPSQIPREEFKDKTNGAYKELWYRPSGDRLVIIALKSNSLIEAITLFAYLFSTFLFLLAFYRLVSFLVRSRLRGPAIKQYWQLSIRSQIHSTIILVSLLSFIVIGVATILFFINRYQRSNQERLSNSLNLMRSQVQQFAKDHKVSDSFSIFNLRLSDKVAALIHDLSEVHGTDVNLYDLDGHLRYTSTEDMDIYSSGVLSPQMNPLAYYRLTKLKQVQTVADEKVGEINYLSIYTPIRLNREKEIAFLNIPSYSRQAELKQEISNFMVTVINLNAFIFLIAGAIALFITNRITSSFTLISEKMRDINLRKMNEEIEWKRDDEIGVLVREYNKMVQKLDDSAEALAKSEREGAWRQMARQVAHEIKNPLTPMKLSIQYLQKAIDKDSPDVKVMTSNVAKTLIEQIDHLSKIASDFSQFANIGNPKNEVFDLHEMLQSLSSLYLATENLNFNWEPVEQRVLVFADKTQLNRLFTNLLQNAVEASSSRMNTSIRMHEVLNGEYITISVADNGEGIPEHTRDRIFTPNFTTKSSGTGLGLAMSKSIVEQAKGEIWFDTKVGEGTTFYVKLPFLRAMI